MPMDLRFLFGAIKNSKIVVMALQVCEYTKIYCILYFKLVNCVICEWYINKTIVTKKREHKEIKVFPIRVS